MTIYSLIDKISVSIGCHFFPKYFRDGLKTVSLKENLDATEVVLSSDLQEGDYKVQARTMAGELGAMYRIAQWKGRERPTIIYHHGASEIPFDYGFKRIFPYQKLEIDANLIVIQAPFHASRRDFSKGMATLENFTAMIATSIQVIEKLITQIKESSKETIGVSGTSLGGYITNFHHIYYNTADRYIPLLAGLNMYDTLFESIYNKSVTEPDQRTKNELNKLFNLRNEFAACYNQNVFPLLAIHDQLVRYEVQVKSYSECSIYTVNLGHATGALAAKRLREHILKFID